MADQFDQLDQLDQLDHTYLVQSVVSAAEAKAGLSDLLRRAEAGEEIIITRNGEPVAKIGPLRTRVGGFLRGEIVVTDPEWWHPDDELAHDFGL